MNKLNTYRTVDTLGKSQLDLIIQVYDGAITAFRAAIHAYQANDCNDGYTQLERAKRFVTHLYTTLDVKAGGEIAEKLAMLYAYIINQVNLAESTKDLTVIDDNITMLDNVRRGWLTLKQQDAKAAAAAEQASPYVEKGRFTTSA
jgi:flagellar protein FliS